MWRHWQLSAQLIAGIWDPFKALKVKLHGGELNNMETSLLFSMTYNLVKAEDQLLQVTTVDKSSLGIFSKKYRLTGKPIVLLVLKWFLNESSKPSGQNMFSS